MITFLIAKFTAWGLPEPLRKLAAWATVVAASVALLFAAKAAYDASVISDHEQDKAVQTIDALDRSAEDRAVDAIKNMIDERDREASIADAAAKEAAKPVERRAKLPPTTIAANCERLRKAYTAHELARMTDYAEICDAQ